MQRGVLLLALAPLLLAGPARAQCTFDRMLKVVVREVGHNVQPGSWAAEPTTIHRLGTQYGRREEAPDPKLPLIPSVTVANGPNVWFVSPAAKTADHLRQEGPTTPFYAQIFAGRNLQDGFEYGCELKFMQTHASKMPRPNTLMGEGTVLHTALVGDYQLTLDVAAKDQRPRQISLAQNGKVVRVLWLEWQQGLTPDMTLFQVPDGYKQREQCVLRSE